ncbi:hypothetical protein CAEBREN_21943 [Caenorhabditis brenneri]|uniref:C2H2-type domain-containing protein n=1 Tax=Caenorhabditis brenneri TaxID=135651 RepID=G0PB84_CAEBE|nr:hypothetical protein CAEBREN_21943 [Caenorhabditis brenneri]
MTTKERKASAARHLIESILAVMVPDGTEEFKQMVQKKFQLVDSWTTGSSEDLNAIMNEVSAQYMSSESRVNRILILSLVANSVSYLKVEQYIPGLSAYMYNKAKKFARRNRNTDLTETKTVVKYNKEAVESFVDFITSPVVMVGLPYGVRNVKLSDGSKIEIPNSIRQQSAKEIIEMYKSVWEDNNESDLPLGTSTMYKILSHCTATKRESTTCVDYFIATGMESFDGLHQIVDYWNDLSLFDAEVTKQMKDELFYAAQYLRTDYRLHIKNSSRISDHCAIFSLSDTSNGKLSETCTQGPEKHFHDLRCDRCERTNAILDKIETHAKEFVAEEEADPTLADGSMLIKHKEELDLIRKYKKGILEMKKHLLRAAVTNKERQTITEELKDNEALITLDFAQKFLPKWHREKQVDYFGKKGISYHIAHTSANVSGVPVQHSFVHIYEGSVTQDSRLVVPTIAHFLKELKKVGVTKVHLRSDNAGAYHSAATLGSLYWLMEETKMSIESYSFSESQNGKSSSDRDANRVKRRVKEYINKGNDVTTSSQFFDALKANPPNGISVYHGKVTITDEGATQWKGVSNLNYFTIEQKGIRARRYRNIGEGVLFEKKHLKPIKGVDEFADEAGFLASNIDSDAMRKAEREAVEKGLQTKFWYTPKCAKKSNCLKEPDEVSTTIVEDVPSNVIGDLYSCPEPGCSSTFLKFFNLEKHILRGKHNIAPERMTERDYALNYFARRLEDANAADSCPIVSTAVKQMKETTPDGKLLEGWALPTKAVRKTFGKEVVKFLVECFDQGVKNKKPMNPFAVEKMMRDSKKFNVNDLLDGRQIAGFFSREADKRRHAATSTSSATSVAPSAAVTQQKKQKHRRSLRTRSHHGKHRRRHAEVANTGEDYSISEEEHPDAGWIRFLKIEEFWDLSDEFYSATFENRDTIFSQK